MNAIQVFRSLMAADKLTVMQFSPNSPSIKISGQNW